MAKDNAIEFTETKYTSRKEMGNELGIVVPDEMWKKVTSYRSSFNNPLSLKDINGRGLTLCLYPTLASKCNQIENKLLKISKDYAGLDEVNGNKQHYLLSAESKCIESLATLLNITIDNQRIKRMITSENPYDEGEERLLNYHSAFEFIKSKYVNKIDIDFLAELYSLVSGNSELTYFYRENDIDDINSIAIIGRSYTKAPCKLIEPMMESLFAFIESSKLSPLNKALISYYYILYVWPFRDYNQEVAFLMAKSIFAHFSMWELGTSLPIEKFALQKENILNRMFNEVRNSADITYVVSPFAFYFDHELDELVDLLKEYVSSDLKQDFYKEDVKEVKAEPVKVIPEEPKEVVKEEPKPVEEPVSIKVEEVQKEEYREVTPLSEEVVKELEKEEAEAEKVPVIEELPDNNEEKAELAVSYIPRELDEKDARRLEQHLLELDIRLKKGEAYFYARHCTLGMYYTIEQYRKALKCVYETARTSMDHLAELGYYRKEKYGKKFVYTPVKRK